MSEKQWPPKRTYTEKHPFASIRGRIINADRKELLNLIKYYGEEHLAALEIQKETGRRDPFSGRELEDCIHAYYFKFIYMETKVCDD